MCGFYKFVIDHTGSLPGSHRPCTLGTNFFPPRSWVRAQIGQCEQKMLPLTQGDGESSQGGWMGKLWSMGRAAASADYRERS